MTDNTKNNNPWSIQDLTTLFNDYSIEGDKIAEKFPNRSAVFIAKKAESLSMKPPHDFTEEEDDLIKTYYDSLGEAICFLLAGRSPKQVSLHAASLGLLPHQ